MLRLVGVLAVLALVAVPSPAPAQGVVVATYAPPVVVAPAPVVTTTYYTPVVTAYSAPVVTAYSAPVVSYYLAPAAVSYRYPVLRPRTTVVRVRPAPVVFVP